MVGVYTVGLIMCHVIAPLLLLLSLISSTHGRPATRQTSARVVNTAGGPLRAFVISRPGLQSVEAFLGVQYATAERFRRPTPSTRRWKGVRVTRDFGPVCPQRIPDMDQLTRTMPPGRLQYYRRLVTYLGNQDEDCLNLNLYVPMIHTTTGTSIPLQVGHVYVQDYYRTCYSCVMISIKRSI